MAESKILDAVAHAIRVEVERTQRTPITAETRLVEDLDLDSIDIVGITMRLEDRFRVQIDVQEIKNFRCVADLIDLVSNQMGKSAA